MFRPNVFKIALLFLLLTPLLSVGAQPARQKSNRNSKLRLAEAAATRIVNRFHHSLDFKGIFADEFVAESGLRSRGLQMDQEAKWKKFDRATKERIYVAMMTLLHLYAEYQMVQKEHEMPPEIAKDSEPKLISASHAPQNLTELNQDFAEIESFASVYRKYLPADVFRGEQYRQSIREGAAFAKSRRHNVPRVENGKAKFSIPARVPVYVVRPEAFDYYFVEEKGKMKLFYIDILPNFTLF